MTHHSLPRVDWYCRIGNEVFGPLTTDELIDFAKKGTLTPNDMVRMAREGEWVEASTIPPLFAHLLERHARKSGKAGSETSATAAANAIKYRHLRELQAGSDAKGPPSVGRALGALGRVLSAPWEKLVEAFLWFLEKLSFLQRLAASRVTLVIVGAIFIALLVRLMPIDWSRPRDAREAYIAIWNELKEHRARPASDAEWDEFSQRANDEISQIVKRLEKTSSKDAETLELIRVGRDYLPRVLSDARREESYSERQFEEHLKVAKAANFMKQSANSPADVFSTCLMFVDGILIVLVLVVVVRRLIPS